MMEIAVGLEYLFLRGPEYDQVKLHSGPNSFVSKSAVKHILPTYLPADLHHIFVYGLHAQVIDFLLVSLPRTSRRYE